MPLITDPLGTHELLVCTLRAAACPLTPEQSVVLLGALIGAAMPAPGTVLETDSLPAILRKQAQ